MERAISTIRGAPPAFHLLAKPTGAICNLDCTYCFFLSKEMLYPGSRFRMADDLLETYIRQLLEAHRTPEVAVAWQGGEPTLMGLDFFRRSIELERKHAKPGQRVLNTIQTNGTLIDEEWATFFREHDFLVGISIDGPREIHDTYRVDKGGKPTFGRVMEGLRHLKEQGVEWNALTTVHAANEDLGREVYRFLRDECGARFMQFIPIIERATPETFAVADTGWGEGVHDRPLYVQEGDLVTARSITAEGYGRFLIDVFEEWVRRDIGEVYVQMFDVALGNWYGAPPSLCVHSETCGLALALEHTGDLYS
jgi:serine-type anaerobic sulfatase-maturating enzyme